MAFERYNATRLWREAQEEFSAAVGEAPGPVAKARWLRSGRGRDFSGAAAVELVEQIFRARQARIPKEVTRDKAAKVCAFWLSEGFLRPSVPDPSTPDFQDSPSVFYRIKENGAHGEEAAMELSPALTRSRSVRVGHRPPATVKSLPTSPCPQRKRKPGLLEMCEYSESPFRPRGAKAAMFSSRVSPEDSRMRTPSSLKVSHGFTWPPETTPEGLEGEAGTSGLAEAMERSRTPSIASTFSLEDYDEEAVHDAALFRLLTLVEVPILDGILHVKEEQHVVRRKSGGLLERLMENLALRTRSRSPGGLPARPSPLLEDFRREELYSLAFAAAQLNAADTDRELSGVLKGPGDVPKAMRLLHDRVLEFHARQGREHLPLIPERLANLVVEIGTRVGLERRGKTAEAVQLLLLLLPFQRRSQLRHASAFLAHVLQLLEEGRGPEGLSPAKVSDLWLDVLVPKCRELGEERGRRVREELVGWVVGGEAWEVPAGLVGELEGRTEEGGSAGGGPSVGLAYCEQVSPAEWEAQALDETQRSLVAIADSVAQDPVMAPQAKLQWFATFHKHYPLLAQQRYPHWI